MQRKALNMIYRNNLLKNRSEKGKFVRNIINHTLISYFEEEIGDKKGRPFESPETDIDAFYFFFPNK